MKIGKTGLFIGAATLLTASAATAQDHGARETVGPYISGGYNYLDFDEEIGGDFDNNSAGYDLTESLAIRADYTHYDFSDANAESFGINLEYKFGA